MLHLRRLTSHLSSFNTVCVLSNKIITNQSVKWPTIRHLSCTNMLCLKMYVEFENLRFYKYMKDKGGYQLWEATPDLEKCISTDEFNRMLKENWKDKSAQELYEAFAKFSIYASKNNTQITSKVFDEFIDCFTDSMEQLNDENLRKITSYLRKWRETPSVFSRNFVEIWAALDNVFYERLKDYSADYALLNASCFQALNLSRKSTYFVQTIAKLGRKAKKLSKEELVQCMFYICTIRYPPDNIMDFEMRFEQLLNELDIEEIALVCAGFFKSKTPIRNTKLLDRLMIKVMDNVSIIDNISASAIFKVLRLSIRHSNAVQIIKMLDCIIPEMGRFSSPTLVQIALLPVTSNIFHQESLTFIADQFKNNPTSFKLKDIERLALAFTEFKFIDNELYDCILNEFYKPERADELETHPKSLNVCLSYLTRVKIFPKDWFNKVLHMNHIKMTYGGNFPYNITEKDYGKELLILDCTIEAEIPDYVGNRLPAKLTFTLAKIYTKFMPSDESFHMSFIEKTIHNALKTIENYCGGSQYVFCGHILPNYQRGVVVICLDPQGNPVDLTNFKENSQFGPVIKAPQDGNRWYSFIFLGKYSYLFNSNRLSSPMLSKLRQTEKIGYTPVLIDLTKWGCLKPEDKTDYIANTINEANESINKNHKNVSKSI